MVNIKLNMLAEVITRIVLWALFLHYDAAKPFIRHISPNEIWKHKYPVTDSIVPATSLWIIICLYPILFLVLEYYITGKYDDHSATVLALTLAYGMNGFVTSVIKIMVGRPRPDFYYRCFPNGSGENYEKCIGDEDSYTDGRKSFPSGHSSFAFTCMVFMTLYLARKLQLFDSSKRTVSWHLCLCMAQLLIAAGIAISRTCDYHHHYEDVIGGSILGTVIAYLCYKLYFPKATAPVDEQ